MLGHRKARGAKKSPPSQFAMLLMGRGQLCGWSASIEPEGDHPL